MAASHDVTARRELFAISAVLLGLATAFAAINFNHAYHPTDDGWILAYAWRITNGEVPYRDFIYERGPLSPYLATPLLTLPEGWQIQAGRIVFYLEVAVSGLVPALWAIQAGRLRMTTRALAFMAIGFLLAIHSFPPMPWPTTDGLLLASLGLVAFMASLDARPGRSLWRLGASVAFALAGLAKQPYAVMYALLVGYAVFETGWRHRPRMLIASALPGAAIVATTLGVLQANGALGDFVYQLGSAAGTRELLVAGILEYGRSFLLAFGAIAFAIGIAATAGNNDVSRVSGWMRALVPIILGGAAVWMLAGAGQFSVIRESGHIVFWLAAGALTGRIAADVRLGAIDGTIVALDGGLLAIAWASSISFAYRTPLLGLVAVGVIFGQTMPRPFRRERLVSMVAAGITTVAILMLNLLYPYRDVARGGQVADLGEIYPRLGHLYTNTANYERFSELRDLATRLPVAGQAFVVMPEYPVAYFASGSRNPLSLDWLLDAEYRGNEPRLISELERAKPVVFVEREDTPIGLGVDPPRACRQEPGSAYSSLVRYVVTRWDLVIEGHFFCVYRSAVP